ncbi:ssrAB-activated protein [Superficieibacter electus]|uniref:SsrAB-activated protein n=1 Tax=Superficieibacter electus TaxID=2022662 RepID=A0A2P5GUR1_9ENTR|nr:SrfA family protein [Superficieibacter electus]POP50283.1 ssrAB-activated protein [Superficieibacter electus]
MAKTLLRSGDLDDFQAVGGGGQAVFDSALQIRETLRLRKQQAMVDCLAIPQLNDDGDRVNWYSPLEGQAVSWLAADSESRARALQYLETTLSAAVSLSRTCMRSGKTAQQLFGSLLEKALQFPGENHLFLVAGKPVITFWGFVNLNENAREDVLDCLRQSAINEPTIMSLPDEKTATPPVVTLSQIDEPLLSPPALVAKPPAMVLPEPPAMAAEQPARATPRRRFPFWIATLVAVAIAIAVVPLLIPTSVTQTEMPTVDVTGKTRAPLPEIIAQLPLHQADVVKPAPPEPAKPVVIAAIPKEALVMDASQVRAGMTRFLNGNWQVQVAIQDPATGNAPGLRFQIQNNKGTARLVHGKNIVCRAEIFSGLHQTGELMIKSRNNARCSDGSRYPMPEITCKAGMNDVAQCVARYDAAHAVPATFRKIGA